MTEITLTEFARVAIADVDRQNDFVREKIAQSSCRADFRSWSTPGLVLPHAQCQRLPRLRPGGPS